MTDKIKNVYNDAIFGKPSWSSNFDKIVFIGEPVDKTYTNYYELKKKDSKESEEKEKEKLDQESKFLYKENFGETLHEKVNPKMFIYDVNKNELIAIDLDPLYIPL